jgi:SAM-dependent methyltransferase
VTHQHEEHEDFQVAQRPARNPLAAGLAARHGVLPSRYDRDFWDRPFRRELERILQPGLRILDVGSGARPAIAPEDRPPDCIYVGLDISAQELARAAPGSYDEAIVADVVAHRPELDARFDLVVSWFVLEHVKPIDAALDNMRRYLGPGGWLLAQLAGGRSPSGLANRAIPHSLAKVLLERLLGQDPRRVFPAHYDRCHRSALIELLSGDWEQKEVRALHTGAFYARFSRLLTGLFVAYEEWVCRHRWDDLATYYLLVARRASAVEVPRSA